MLSIIAIGVRAFQLLFSIVLLGLSVTLVKEQVYGSAPTTTKYSSFLGAMGMVVSAVGLVGLFVEALPALVPMGLDAVLGLLMLAGGIAWAIGLKGVSCTNTSSESNCDALYANALLNEGCVDVSTGGQTVSVCGVIPDNQSADAQSVCNTLGSNCQKAQAAEAFSFLLLVLAVVLLAVGFVIRRKGGSVSSRPSYV